MEKKIFQSKYRNYRYVIKPRQRIVDNLGRVTNIPGKAVEFKDGMFETDDKEIIEALMNSPYYGVDFWCLNPDERKEVPQENLERAKKEEGVEEAGPTACPYEGCNFKAKTIQGLKAHIRIKHKNA